MASEKHGLSYSIADTAAAHAENIDRLGSASGADAATARLNRDLINVMANWIADEGRRGSRTVDVMIAAMHGVNSVCGTILVNLPAEQRARAAAKMRAHLREIYDAMVKATAEASP